MLKDCIVTLNINGIPRSFSLRGISDNSNIDQDIVSGLLSEISSGSFSDSPYGVLAKEIMSFYKKTLPKNNISGKEIPKGDPEVINDNSNKDTYNEKTYDGLSELSNDYPEVIPGILSIINEIGVKYNEFPKVIINNIEGDLQQRSNYNPESNNINIFVDKNDPLKDKYIKRQIIHESVHGLLDKYFSPNRIEIRGVVEDLIKTLEKTKNKKGERGLYKINENPILTVKEYLAEYYTGLVNNELKRNEEVLSKLQSVILKQSPNEISYYTELVKGEFISNEDDIAPIIRKFKYGSKNDFFGKETQSILEEVWKSKEINTKDYNISDTYDRHNEGQTDFQFELNLSRLTTFDLIKTSYNHNGQDREIWLPIIYQYYDRQKQKRIFKVANKIRSGEHKGKYVYNEIESDKVISYAHNIGLINSSKTKTNINGLNAKLKDYQSKKSDNYFSFSISNSDITIDNVIRHIPQGSFIKTKEGTYPIYRVLASTIEVVDNNKLKTIPFNKITQVIMEKGRYLYDSSLDLTTINDNLESAKFDNKKFAFSNFMFTDKLGGFKKLPNGSLYDYNQILGNNYTYFREEFDAFFKEVVDNAIKNKESVREYLNKHKGDYNPTLIKYMDIYNNRKDLIRNLPSNTYVAYDYIGNDGYKYSGKGKIIASTSDTIKVFVPKGDGFVISINIIDNIAAKNHPAIRRIIYDNQETYNMTKFFKTQQKALNIGYRYNISDNKKSYAERVSNIKQFLESNDMPDAIDYDKNGIPTSLSDIYYYEYIDSELFDNLNDSDKNRYLADFLGKITPGCIVFEQTEKGNYPRIVTDIDNKGEIYIGDIIESEGVHNGNYIRKKINPYNISAIGYNIRNIDSLGIEANPFYKGLLKGIFGNLLKSKEPKVFNSKKAAEKWQYYRSGSEIYPAIKLKNIKNNNYIILPEYTYNKNKERLDKSYEKVPFENKYTLMLNFNGEFTSLKNVDVFSHKYTPSSSLSKKAYNLIEIGDLITYKGEKYDKPITLVVTNKIKDKNGEFKYKAESISKNGKKIMQIIIGDYNKDKINYIKFQNNKTNRISENPDVFNSFKKNPVENINRSKFSKHTDDYNKSYDSFIKVMAFSKELEDRLGVKFTIMNSDEISSIFDNEYNIYSDKRAFVKDGEIVLNSDLCSFAEPLHELTHVILGEMKINNLNEYKSIINTVVAHPDYNKIAKNYPELSDLDLNEEVFSTIFGEYYAGKIRNNSSKEWNKKNKNWFTKVINKIKSFFSKLFNINIEEIDVPDMILMNMSLNDIMDRFGGNILNNKYTDYIDSYNTRYDKIFKDVINNINKNELIKEKCYG